MAGTPSSPTSFFIRIEIVTTLKHLKKCNYVDKPVGPNVSIALGGSIFSMRHLLAYGHRPGGSRLSASPRTVLSRFLLFFSMFTTADSGAAASAQRRKTITNHLKQRLISTETTELA